MKEAEAKVAHAEADRKESEAARNKSRVDIAVAQAAQERMQSMVDYATLTAPFDGVVSRRNINTGDFVKPPTAVEETPLYVVQRRDLMRVFVEVPEADAVWVKAGTPARIRHPDPEGPAVLREREANVLFSETTNAHPAGGNRPPQPRRPPAARDVRLCGVSRSSGRMS